MTCRIPRARVSISLDGRPLEWRSCILVAQDMAEELQQVTYTAQHLRRWQRIPARKPTWRLTRRVIARRRRG